MVSRKLLTIIVAIVAIGHCHGQVGNAEEFQNRVTAENKTSPSFGERLQPAPTSATVQEIHAELNRTGETNETSQQVDNKKPPTSEPLEGHSSDLLASIFGEPSELEISGLHLPAAETSANQRRFDETTLAMASTGQAQGNRFLVPSEAQFGTNSRLMLKQQQLMAALDPMGANDPYFMDSANPMASPDGGSQSSDQSRTIQSTRRQSLKRRTGGHNLQRQSARSTSTEVEDEEDPDYRKTAKFAEGDDIFKDDNELVSRQKSASIQGPAQRSIQTDDGTDDGAGGGGGGGGGGGVEADGDDDDDNDNNEDHTGRQVHHGDQSRVLPLARSGSNLNMISNNRRQTPKYDDDGSRRPLKGIEDSAQVLDERLDASNVKASKRKPEVELVLRSYQNRPVTGKRQIELEAEDVASADSQQLVEKSGTSDLQTAAGHHHGHHGHHHYYQYAGVPKKKAWKMGFKRGNHKHEISRHEKGYKNKFHSSFKWHAKEKCKKKKKCHSVGKMSWHYEHHDKKKKHHY